MAKPRAATSGSADAPAPDARTPRSRASRSAAPASPAPASPAPEGDARAPRPRRAPRAALPPRFAAWFAERGWEPRPHQLDLLRDARAGRSTLLVAPTGAGKTLAGFLPTLVELEAAREAGAPHEGLHTLYVSPLKALAVDIARNLEAPVAEMGLGVRIETRTGDTPAHRRTRQVAKPPHILLTTPEQLALLVANREARTLFKGLRRVVLDELHALVTSKRGDLLSLDLARVRTLAPNLSCVGLSATVREPDELRRWLVPQDETKPLSALVTVKGGAPARLSILGTDRRLPMAGHTARHAIPEILRLIASHKTTLVFVNTRMQAEFVFQELWAINEDALPIALHHGSLDAQQRRRVEAAMSAGALKGVVCTSTLDLGIDWGDVDLVVNVGAPKGASRLMQRIGRSNHRLDEPSEALLVASNRFEMLECRAALDAVAAAAQDTPDARVGGLDVLCQHILGMACAEPFTADDLHREIRSAAPYADLDRETFDDALSFVATGGYALKAYERFARMREGKDGLWRVTDARVAQRYRMNVGTIVESPVLKVRVGRLSKKGEPGGQGALLRGGRPLGEVEEEFVETLTPGDTFLFAGQVLRFEGVAGDEVVCARAPAGTDPKIPSWAGSKFPLSTFLAKGVRGLIADRAGWKSLPPEIGEWLSAQGKRSRLPRAGELLLETFPRAGRFYLVGYPFEGRLAHQTMCMLMTRRLERLKLKPLGFVMSDYAFAIWAARDLSAAVKDGTLDLAELLSEDMLGDDLEEWLAESPLMRRTFRQCAVIAGLIDRQLPGERRRTGRQVTISTDLIYDVLRRYEPRHVLLRAARADAATGLLDIRRLGELLARIRGRIVHRPLPRVSPLAVSILLEIGREAVYGDSADDLLAEAEAELLAEAMS